MSDNIVPQSFPVQSGDTLQLPITVTDRNDQGVDLTGASAVFKMARNPSAQPVIDSSASPATATCEVTDVGPPGVVTVTITDENTEPLVGDYYYECKVTDSFGNESTIARGWITMVKNLF